MCQMHRSSLEAIARNMDTSVDTSICSRDCFPLAEPVSAARTLEVADGDATVEAEPRQAGMQATYAKPK